MTDALYAKILDDAKNERKILKSGSKYYRIAKKIKEDKIEYTFVKLPYIINTCCQCYPEACYIGSKECCGHMAKLDEMGDPKCACSEIKFSKFVKRMGNCYNGCCALIKKIHARKFYIQWKINL